ncbi:MAG TPA: hypothetical protein VF196_02575 [Casimicrobiaceae bacterium]
MVNFALEVVDAAPQGGDMGPVLRGGLLELGGLRARFLARDAGDLVLQDSCDVRHALVGLPGRGVQLCPSPGRMWCSRPPS